MGLVLHRASGTLVIADGSTAAYRIIFVGGGQTDMTVILTLIHCWLQEFFFAHRLGLGHLGFCALRGGQHARHHWDGRPTRRVIPDQYAWVLGATG